MGRRPSAFPRTLPPSHGATLNQFLGKSYLYNRPPSASLSSSVAKWVDYFTESVAQWEKSGYWLSGLDAKGFGTFGLYDMLKGNVYVACDPPSEPLFARLLIAMISVYYGEVESHGGELDMLKRRRFLACIVSSYSCWCAGCVLPRRKGHGANDIEKSMTARLSPCQRR